VVKQRERGSPRGKRGGSGRRGGGKGPGRSNKQKERRGRGSVKKKSKRLSTEKEKKNKEVVGGGTKQRVPEHPPKGVGRRMCREDR